MADIFQGIYASSTAPSFSTDLIWRDTSATPNVLRIYSGGAWILMNAGDTNEGLLGSIYNVAGWANLSGFTVNGATVATPGGTGNPITFSGGSNTFTQTLDLNGNTCLEYWKMSITFALTQAPSATTYGIGIGTRSTNTLSPTNIMGKLDMTTAGGDNLAIYGSSGNTLITTSSTNFAFSQNDVIELTIERVKNLIYVTAVNTTTQGAPVTASLDYNSSGYYTQNTGTFSIYSFGGTLSVYSLNISSNETVGADVMVIGDSKIGYDQYNLSTNFPRLLGNQFKSVVASWGPADMTRDVISRIAEILRLKPKQVLLEIGCNDQRAGVSESTYQTNYASIRNSLISINVSVFDLAPFYETSIDLTPQYNYIKTTYPSTYIDTFLALKNAGAANVLNGDGIHPNQYGHNIVANTILDAYVLAAGPIVKTSELQQVTYAGAITLDTITVGGLQINNPTVNSSVYTLTHTSSALILSGGTFQSTQDMIVNTLTVGLGGGGVSDNTAFGLNALAANTSGHSALGIGYNALAAITTGDYNHVIGWNALSLAQTAYENTAFGFNVMAANANTAAQNTVIGAGGMYEITTGQVNVGVGHATLQNITTGSFNVSVGGSNGGGSLTTGSYNTLVGFELNNTANIVAGNYNTILGANIAISSDVSNTVIVGDGAGNYRFYSPASGNILFGTTTDNGSKLQVNGNIATTSMTVSGETVSGDGSNAGITTYSRTATVANNNYSEGIQEFSFVTANTGFLGYIGVESWAYVTGGVGGSHGKFTNYITAFSAGQLWDGSLGVGSHQLGNHISYFSAIQTQSGGVLNAYDHYVSEINTVGGTTANPAVINHYAFYAEAFTYATNNYGIYINGAQKNYFGGGVGLSTTSPNAQLDVTANNIATTITNTNGIVLSNNTAATSVVTAQYSPMIRFRGYGWNNTDLASYPSDWVILNQVYNTTPTGTIASELAFRASTNLGAYSSEVFGIGTSAVTSYVLFYSSQISTGFISFNGGAAMSGTGGAILIQDGLSPTSFSIYNTIDNTQTNYEYLTLSWIANANVMTIKTAANGTGVVRPIAVLTSTAFGTAATPYSDIDIIHNSLGLSPADTNGISLSNNTAATSAIQGQSSPFIRFASSSWNTGSSSNIPTVWTINSTAAGSSVAGLSNANLNFAYSLSGGAYTTIMSLGGNGQIEIHGQTTSTSSITASGGFASGMFDLISSPVSGMAEFWWGNAPTGLRFLNFTNGSGPVNSEWMDLTWTNTSNVFTIVPGASGTGVATRSVAFLTTVGFGQTNPQAPIDVLQSLTGSSANSAINVATTWNTTGNPSALKINVTNTASGSTAKLLDIEVGGANRFAVDKTGNVTFVDNVIFNTATTAQVGTIFASGNWGIGSGAITGGDAGAPFLIQAWGDAAFFGPNATIMVFDSTSNTNVGLQKTSDRAILSANVASANGLMVFDLGSVRVGSPSDTNTGQIFQVSGNAIITQGPVTSGSSTISFEVDATWNTTGTPAAILVNVTNTASGAGSKLLDLQVGSTSQFSVDPSGNVAMNVSTLSGNKMPAVNVTAATSSVTAAQSGSIITNTGSTVVNVVDLPATSSSTVGVYYFLLATTYTGGGSTANLRVKANGTDIISYSGGSSPAGGTVSSGGSYLSALLVCTAAGVWSLLDNTGSWISP